MLKNIEKEEGVIEQLMYGGKINVRFLGPTDDKPNRHIYMVDGKRKTGVTTIIGIKDKSRPLVIWATELAQEFLLGKIRKGIEEQDVIDACRLHTVRKEEAATIGDQAHGWIEKYIKGEKPEMPDDPKVLIAINGFLDWVDKHNVKFLSSERVVYSKKHDYIGKMDIEAKVNGKLCLVDIKTSNSLYNDYCLQTAAYVKADEEEGNRKYSGRWLVRVSKESETEYLKRMMKKGKTECDPYVAFEAKYLDEDKNNIDRDFKAFLACKELFDWDRQTDFWVIKNKKTET